jgi:hypothetical protein
MGSSTKRRQTIAKIARERAVLEKRARKQEKIAARKAAAAGAEATPEDAPALPDAET